ncbi:uncharacterized protein LY79DRAFT_653645 [Colletotrichum navitas]|uniref:Uncharacterized protein n=1 Tax=Colletotrichum navitas TaxID=681940 RepID=A0AAD8UZQ2_9PEZI|nr:uncharacterized protein LY79DRAFT_653645 [Colletotrichum navitas]KAK1570019.1 hypothetical protein LY79DRAFT_653645 [Colletotrichum navitas]
MDCSVGARDGCKRLWVIVLLGVYSLVMTILVMVIADACSVQVSTPLGGDPNGFVPAGVGAPMHWKTFVRNDSNPYHIPDDVFTDQTKTRKTVDRLIQIHSSAVRINGRHARWVHDDGSVSTLPATFTPPSMGQEQVYFLRGLYQMRCIAVLLQAYGDSIHGRNTSVAVTAETETDGEDNQDVWHWPPEHVAYCLNVLADGVQCTADATPLSFVNGFGSGRLTDGQQTWCRDWDDLRGWAANEKRSVPTAQGGSALKGPFGQLWRTVLP